VEVIFDPRRIPSLEPILNSLGIEPCQDSQLLLKRVFSSSGTNRQFVNGSPTTLQSLKQIGELLVDIHGPHDHQSLLKIEAQLRILDRFAGLEKERQEFADQLGRVRAIEDQKRALVMDEKEFQQQLDLLSHQVNEIEAARLSIDEETKLESDYRVASNAQKLQDLVGRAQEALSEGETNASTVLGQAERALRDLAAIDSQAVPLQETNNSIFQQVQELAKELSRYAAKIDLDPDRLHHLSERMTLVQGLKRKYGKTLAEVLEFGKTAKERLSQLQNREVALTKLEAEATTITRSMGKKGEALRAARKKAIPKLTQVISKHLKELGFGQSSFTSELTPSEPSSSGMDAIEFRFAPNPGEPAKPLREIASSGEMARVMLALKTALADQDEVPVLVFDEVDANVGGEIGNSVGEKMAQIGKRHQVLCITHLPQVAAHGKNHLVVVKSVEKGRTLTQIDTLTSEKRAEEIARMLGGKGDTALKHAREMLRMATK
jgi:DNA repair protein RecN (Recombination protein N)